MNTIYSQVSHSLDHIFASNTTSSQNSRIHSLYSGPLQLDYVHPTKKNQLRQINSIMKQKISRIDHHFHDLQKSFANQPTLLKKVGQRDYLKKQSLYPDHGFKNTISTQLDQIYFDQTQPSIPLLNYDSTILAQKDIRQKILDVYDLIQKSQNAGHMYKFNIQLEEYGRSPKMNGTLNEQYGTRVAQHYLYKDSSIQPRQYSKKSYIAYNEQDSSEQRVCLNQMTNKLKQNNQTRGPQNKFKQADSKDASTFKKSHKNKLSKELFKAIQERIVTSSCTFNSHPMSKDVDKVKYLAARMNKQTIQRDHLINQLKMSYKSN